MKLEILTPDKSLFKGEINSISLPGKQGSFMLMHNHAPLISTLSKGTIKVQTKEQKEEKFEVAGGVIEIKKNLIVILADV
jgi:F-type H+-transporting ATPase subunit epsilon